MEQETDAQLRTPSKGPSQIHGATLVTGSEILFRRVSYLRVAICSPRYTK
jgi:hypothetical protein